MTTPSVFWDNIAESYASKPVKNQTAYEQTLAATRAHLKPTDHVLELGCGTGSTALALAGNVQSITASDISPRMIDIAHRKRSAEGVQNVEFLPAAISEQVFDWQTYDVVLAFNLLHLVPDLDRALADVFARLRPGGTFISKSPCLGEMSFLIRGLVRGMQSFGRAPDVIYFTTQDLEAAIRWAGFDMLSSRTFDKAPKNRFIVARKPL